MEYFIGLIVIVVVVVVGLFIAIIIFYRWDKEQVVTLISVVE